jgi:hypothetical protein
MSESVHSAGASYRRSLERAWRDYRRDKSSQNLHHLARVVDADGVTAGEIVREAKRRLRLVRTEDRAPRDLGVVRRRLGRWLRALEEPGDLL